MRFCGPRATPRERRVERRRWRPSGCAADRRRRAPRGDDIVLFTVACENVVCFESYSGLTTCVRLQIQCRVIGAPSPGHRRRLSRPCQCPARALRKKERKRGTKPVFCVLFIPVLRFHDRALRRQTAPSPHRRAAANARHSRRAAPPSRRAPSAPRPRRRQRGGNCASDEAVGNGSSCTALWPA